MKSTVGYIWAVLREKVPNVLSRCHTKRRTGTHGRARPSFGMTPTVKKNPKFFKNLFFQKSLKSWCHTKRRAGVAPRACPSFGMTTTQDIMDLLFLYCTVLTCFVLANVCPQQYTYDKYGDIVVDQASDSKKVSDINQ